LSKVLYFKFSVLFSPIDRAKSCNFGLSPFWIRYWAAKFRPMLSARGLWAGRDLYHATPTVTRSLWNILGHFDLICAWLCGVDLVCLLEWMLS
jgi:hypothetical protein